MTRNQATASIPARMAEQVLFSLALIAAFGQSGAIVGGYGGAADVEKDLLFARQQAANAGLSDLTATLASIGRAAGSSFSF